MTDRDPFVLGGHADPVLVLDAERRRLMQDGFAVRDAADAALKTMAPDIRQYPKIQVGRLLTGPGDTYEPILASTEAEIRAHCERHRRARAGTWGNTHPCVLRVSEREEALVAELRAQLAARQAAEDASGYTALDRKANELVNAWCAIEDHLMETTATSADGVLAQLEIFANDVKWNEVPTERIDARAAVLAAGIRLIAGGAP